MALLNPKVNHSMEREHAITLVRQDLYFLSPGKVYYLKIPSLILCIHLHLDIGRLVVHYEWPSNNVSILFPNNYQIDGGMKSSFRFDFFFWSIHIPKYQFAWGLNNTVCCWLSVRCTLFGSCHVWMSLNPFIIIFLFRVCPIWACWAESEWCLWSE